MKKAKQGNWLVALSMLLSSSWAHADWTVNMREGVTAISRDVYSLHMIIFWVCVVIGVLVFGVMILSMLMHRKSLGVKPADFHHSTKLEIMWTIIPVVILVGDLPYYQRAGFAIANANIAMPGPVDANRLLVRGDEHLLTQLTGMVRPAPDLC